VSGPVALGHTRLSIIDLHTGAQPVPNEDESVWIVYNGEIYNYRELRDELRARGHIFRTTSDTEVIVHLYEEYGTACLARLQGMFAFAVWDARKRMLFCARDRVGIKPLYYAELGDSLVFASEIKALLEDPDVDRKVNYPAIDTFLTFTYVPGRETLFSNIFKLEPGHYLLVENGRVTRARYWDLAFTDSGPPMRFGEAVEKLADLVASTVRGHMVSDVPVGVLLSGGVDSTVILQCASEEGRRTLRTFTIGFDGAGFADERRFAQIAAERYRSLHHAITISPAEFERFLDDYIWHMEEPVSEPPAIALHYVSKLARQFVKVVLSGEGGDEAFGGYQTYRNLVMLERIKLLLGLRLSAHFSGWAHAASSVHASPRLRKYGRLLGCALPSYYYSRRSTPFAFFPRSRKRFYSEDLLAKVAGNRPERIVEDLFHRVEGQPPLHQMLYVDTKTWLPDDLLIKADKITMANSLELRVPLLDHHVLEFAARLPSHFKVRGFATKRVFRKAFADGIPKPILRRPKTGFPVPIRQWLQKELREFVNDHLLSERSLGRGYFERRAIDDLLLQCSRGQPVSHEVFSLLALELWHRQFIDPVLHRPRGRPDRTETRRAEEKQVP
jgi:asparagine synthase (glutamine-hydrolysing)